MTANAPNRSVTAASAAKTTEVFVPAHVSSSAIRVDGHATLANVTTAPDGARTIHVLATADGGAFHVVIAPKEAQLEALMNAAKRAAEAPHPVPTPRMITEEKEALCQALKAAAGSDATARAWMRVAELSSYC